MKLTMNTTQLQAMLGKAVKGAGNDKTKPETEYVAISLKGGKLTLMTIDRLRANYLYITADNIEGDDLYVAVSADILSRLVSKITSDKTTLEVTNKALTVKGNGQYQIALDAPDGNAVHLHDPLDPDNIREENMRVGAVNSDIVGTLLTSIKSALLTTKDEPWYCCYYADKDDVLASDRYTVGSYAKGFLNAPYLIDARTMDLVGLLTGDIDIMVSGNHMIFEANDGCVYTTIPDNIDRYAIDALRNYVVQDFEHSCKVDKIPMLNLLDRISLFVGLYDNGEITLSFGEDGLTVTSKDAEEKIEYAEGSENIGQFVCRTDVNTLTTQIKSQIGNVIEIQYGRDNAIKLIDGDVTSVVALMS